jgi:hypothetical protein
MKEGRKVVKEGTSAIMAVVWAHGPRRARTAASFRLGSPRFRRCRCRKMRKEDEEGR